MKKKHYTPKEKMEAIKLYIQYDFSPSAVIYELGYPSRNRLTSWYQEYKKTGSFEATFRIDSQLALYYNTA